MISKELGQQLIQKEIGIVEAQRRRDLDAVAAALTDDFHEIGSNGRLYSKAEILEALKAVAIQDCRFERFQVLPLDDRAAIVTYIAAMQRAVNGQEQANRSFRSSTWVERDGLWRVIFHHATPLPRG